MKAASKLLQTVNQLNLLDIGNVHHIGAVQNLLKPVMQHALDMLRDTFHKHYVRSSKGHGARRPTAHLVEAVPAPGRQPHTAPGVRRCCPIRTSVPWEDGAAEARLGGSP